MARTSILRITKFSLVLLSILIITAYAISRCFNYARGPLVQIFWPANGTTATTSVITMRGQALRINKITLNDNPISTDEQGNWNQTIIIFPGLNKISIKAQDQFHRSTKSTLDVIGTIDLPSKTSDTNND